MHPDDDDIDRRASEIYSVLTLLEEAEPASPEPLRRSHLVELLANGKPLTADQQRALFDSPRLIAEFRCLKHDFALTLPARPQTRASHAAQGRQDAPVLELPALVAAASTGAADFERQFVGGKLRICPTGIDEQVYVLITLDDPGLCPRTLVVESEVRKVIVSVALPARDSDGDILLIKDLADETDSSIVALLRDPTAKGTFLG